MYQVRAIAVYPVFQLLTDYVCLLTYEFCLSLWKIARCSVILLLPLFNKNNRKQKSQKSQDSPFLHVTNRQRSGDRRRKRKNKPKRSYRFTMGQASFGRMESFIFLYIWNQKCSIQYPVLHMYVLLDIPQSDYSLAKLFICAKI